MDGTRFDHLARRLAAGVSRRDMLKGAIGAALAAAVSGRVVDAAACRPPKAVCRKDGECCSGICGPKDRTGRQRCACPSGQVACGTACVTPASFQTDVKNCGSCGHVCPRTTCQSAICSAGVCGLTPDPARVDHACNDGNPCTENDRCQIDGACIGTPKVCPVVDDQCGTAVCNPATGACETTPVANSTPCNADSNLCTTNDSCQNGVCVAGPATDCSSQTTQCTTAACDPTTGRCVSTPVSDSTPCNADSNLCTVGDVCQSGLCIAGTPTDCSSLVTQCATAACNPATGICDVTPVADATPCNADANVCTVGDVCQTGVCVAGTPKTCASRGPCFINPTCDPVSGDCSYTDAPSTTTCAEGDENCSDGFCCPTANRCATADGDICCPSGQTCQTATGGPSTAPISISICCASGADACLTVEGNTPSAVCCASGETCQTFEFGGGIATGGVCCAGDACLTVGFSGSSPTLEPVCCGTGESCLPLDLSGFPSGGALDGLGVCCATGGESCLEIGFSGSTPTITSTCCASGETCQSVSGTSGFPISTCCANDVCPTLSFLGGIPVPGATCCPADTECVTTNFGGTTIGACCAAGSTVRPNPLTYAIECVPPCDNPCNQIAFSGSTPTFTDVCCDPDICAPFTFPGVSGFPAGTGTCCPAGQSTCIDASTSALNGLKLVCCDSCVPLGITGTSQFDVCCPDGGTPSFSASGFLCVPEGSCPVYTGGLSVTPEVCAEGTVCVTVSLSGTTVGACCLEGEQFAAIDITGTPTFGCCAATQTCIVAGELFPICCETGTSCVSGACTTVTSADVSPPEDVPVETAPAEVTPVEIAPDGATPVAS